MGISWEEAEVAALNRSEWRRSVAQCIHLDAGWVKVKVKVKVILWLSGNIVSRINEVTLCRPRLVSMDDRSRVHNCATQANSAFHPSDLGKLSPVTRLKAERVHLCRVAGNTAG